jgi:hypothetical protein
VRRDNGASYDEYVAQLMANEGIEEPTPAERQRFDRRSKKSLSNREWVNPHDPEARITKLKDGRTQLAYKAEHAVDLDTGAVVALTVQPADRGDPESLRVTLAEAGSVVAEMAGQAAVYANRRRLRTRRGKALMRRRGTQIERSFAHLYGTGGLQRVHLRSQDNIAKRLLLHAAAFNLSLILRRLLGVGTARQGADRLAALCFCFWRRLSTRVPPRPRKPPTGGTTPSAQKSRRSASAGRASSGAGRSSAFNRTGPAGAGISCQGSTGSWPRPAGAPLTWSRLRRLIASRTRCATLVLALDEFRELGIDFVSLREAVDTSTPLGKATFTIIAAMVELVACRSLLSMPFRTTPLELTEQESQELRHMAASRVLPASDVFRAA